MDAALLAQIRARETAIETEALGPSPATSAPRSTIKVSNPDNITPSAARHVRAPLFQTQARQSPSAKPAAEPEQGSSAGVNTMFEWDTAQLIEHFLARGSGTAFAEAMARNQFDGPAFRVYVSDSSANPRPDTENRLAGITEEDVPRWFITRLCIDIELALEWYRSCLSTPEHPTKYSLKDLNNIKLPEFPKGKGLDGRLTPDQLKNLVQSLRSRFNIVDRQYSVMIQEVADHPTQVKAQAIMQLLSPSQRQLDELLGQCFVDASTEKTMQAIITMKRHIFEAGYSGIITMQAMCEGITKLTGPKLGQQLLRVFAPIINAPIDNISKLEELYKDHCEAITLLQGINVSLDPIIKTFLLQQMVAKLAEQPKYNSTLGIPMSMIIMQGYQDHEEMIFLLEKAITEYTNDLSQHHKPRVAPRVVQALTEAEIRLQVCADYREGTVTGYTCAKPNCRRQHIEGTTTCTHPKVVC